MTTLSQKAQEVMLDFDSLNSDEKHLILHKLGFLRSALDAAHHLARAHKLAHETENEESLARFEEFYKHFKSCKILS